MKPLRNLGVKLICSIKIYEYISIQEQNIAQNMFTVTSYRKMSFTHLFTNMFLD